MNSNVQFAMHEPVANRVDKDKAWSQLIARDETAEFFYGVSTTGVFCRPECASRLPRRENVRFFASQEDAIAAGFRACLRCRPNVASSGQPVHKIREYLEINLERRVGLEELGRIVGMSPFTVQRVFKREMGVSPLQYQRALRAGRMRTALKEGAAVTDAVYEAGFSSASRAYEAAQMGMTPARFAQGGRGEIIGWAVAQSPLGWVVIGATERGLCWLALADTAEAAQATLSGEFPAATLQQDEALLKMVQEAVGSVRGEEGQGKVLPLDLRGTAFQLKVWNALRSIPRGETRTYSQLARELGDPRATRAVARACATNRVSVLVPCHRVVGVSGSLTGYRWGVDRKRRLLEAERAR